MQKGWVGSREMGWTRPGGREAGTVKSLRVVGTVKQALGPFPASILIHRKYC